MYELLSESRIKKQNLFNYNEIKKILTNHYVKKIDQRKKLWNLLMFQLWYYSYFYKDNILNKLKQQI